MSPKQLLYSDERDERCVMGDEEREVTCQNAANENGAGLNYTWLWRSTILL
jgi:hypothetical protein